MRRLRTRCANRGALRGGRARRRARKRRRSSAEEEGAAADGLAVADEERRAPYQHRSQSDEVWMGRLRSGHHAGNSTGRERRSVYSRAARCAARRGGESGASTLGADGPVPARGQRHDSRADPRGRSAADACARGARNRCSAGRQEGPPGAHERQHQSGWQRRAREGRRRDGRTREPVARRGNDVVCRRSTVEQPQEARGTGQPGHRR